MERIRGHSRQFIGCLAALVIAVMAFILLLGGNGKLASAAPVVDGPQSGQVTANQAPATESSAPATVTINETSPPAANSVANQPSPGTTTQSTTSKLTTTKPVATQAAQNGQTSQPTAVDDSPAETISQTDPTVAQATTTTHHQTTTASNQATTPNAQATTQAASQPAAQSTGSQSKQQVDSQSAPVTANTNAKQSSVTETPNQATTSQPVAQSVAPTASKQDSDTKAPVISKAPKQVKAEVAKTLADEQTVVTNEQELNDALKRAPNDGTPHTISLGKSFATVEGVFIKDGQNITFINQGGPVQLNIGKQIVVEKGASVTFKGDQKDGISIVPAAADHKLSFNESSYDGQQHSALHVSGTADLTNTTIKDFIIAPSHYSIHDGAVTVSEGTLALNENVYIMNNQLIPDKFRGDGGAGGISAANGATVIMNNGSYVINNKVDLGMTESVGGINIRGGSHLIMNGGHVDQNTGTDGGGVIVGDMNGWYAGHEYPNVATMVMNGGTVDGNSSKRQAGGIFVFGNGDVTINGGSVSHNQTGFLEAKPSLTASGAGIAVHVGYPGFDTKTAEDYGKINAAKLTINDAVIDGNHASAAGGGIYVNSNNVTINKAKIANNVADIHGGGIYVSIADFTLHLGNSLITKNEAVAGQDLATRSGAVLFAGSGGGIWFCPTGSAEIFVTDGTAIYDNQALKQGDEILTEAKTIDQYTTLADRMLGGGSVKWYHDRDGQQETDPVTVKNVTEFIGLKNDATDAAKAIAASLATVIITGNKAPRGGGIGANGSVIFGTKLENDKTIKVNKEWQMAGTDVKQPEKVVINIVLDDPTSPLNGTVIDSIELAAANNWTGAFEGLPTNIAYKLTENPVAGFTASNTELKDLGNGVFEITFTNKAGEEPKTPDKPTTPPDKPTTPPDKPTTPPDKPTTPPENPGNPTTPPTTPVVTIDVPKVPVPVPPLTPRIDQPTQLSDPTPGDTPAKPMNPVKSDTDKQVDNPIIPTSVEEDAVIPGDDQKITGPVTLGTTPDQPAAKATRAAQSATIVTTTAPAAKAEVKMAQQKLPQTGDQDSWLSVVMGLLMILITFGGMGLVNKRVNKRH